jgi:hypothetical protein
MQPSMTNQDQKSQFEVIESEVRCHSRATRLVLSVLTVIILGTIGWCNLPEEYINNWLDQAEQVCTPETSHSLRVADWGVRYLGYVSGLSSKWQMYGGQSRFNWRYIISAVYIDDEGNRSEEVVLPLPRQSERTWAEEKLFDFKEAKFLLNIYSDELARETYARYLARQYPRRNGRTISSIRINLVTQNILPPIVAVLEQRLLEEKLEYRLVNEFDVSMECLGPSRRIAGVFDTRER